MKHIPLYGQPCKLYEIHTLMDNPVNYMTTLYGNPYMKYIPLYGQPCKLYETHTLIWTTL